ncbi:multidrug ABC transporter ATP-binding protein, partial [Paenibacillus sp. MCAF20]
MLNQLKRPFQYERPERAAEAKTGTGDKAEAPKKKPRARNASLTLKRMGGYLMQYKGRLSAVVAMVVLSSALSLLGPYLAGKAVDRFLIDRDSGFITFLALMA